MHKYDSVIYSKDRNINLGCPTIEQAMNTVPVFYCGTRFGHIHKDTITKEIKGKKVCVIGGAGSNWDLEHIMECDNN